ncbi:hypothetical protein LZ30DRAFT_81603 [Colletotrichum cereale]|nr:hypothetical protein LZ30DRAFT_81603 [Colletotrichum cereale]
MAVCAIAIGSPSTFQPEDKRSSRYRAEDPSSLVVAREGGREESFHVRAAAQELENILFVRSQKENQVRSERREGGFQNIPIISPVRTSTNGPRTTPPRGHRRFLSPSPRRRGPLPVAGQRGVRLLSDGNPLHHAMPPEAVVPTLPLSSAIQRVWIRVGVPPPNERPCCWPDRK